MSVLPKSDQWIAVKIFSHTYAKISFSIDMPRHTFCLLVWQLAKLQWAKIFFFFFKFNFRKALTVYFKNSIKIIGCELIMQSLGCKIFIALFSIFSSRCVYCLYLPYQKLHMHRYLIWCKLQFFFREFYLPFLCQHYGMIILWCLFLLGIFEFESINNQKDSI